MYRARNSLGTFSCRTDRFAPRDGDAPHQRPEIRRKPDAPAQFWFRAGPGSARKHP